MVSGPVKDVFSDERPADTDLQEAMDAGCVQGDPVTESIFFNPLSAVSKVYSEQKGI